MKNLVEELKYLTSIPALSGLEDKMIKEMIARFTPLADEVNVDKIGNVTATFKGKHGTSPSLLIFAHIDELGLMISKIENDGFLRFNRIGGVPEKTLMGQFVDVHALDGNSFVAGLVGTYAHHLTPPEWKYTVPNHEKMYIDLGLDSCKEVLAKGIDIGSAVTYQHNFHQIGNNKITSKTLDNRIGILLLIALAEHLKDNPAEGTVHLVASVQEEFNVRGVMPAFYRLEPDAAICIDITPACDPPDLNHKYSISLGKGPAIMQMNFHGRGTLGGLIPNPKLRMYMEKTLTNKNIPFQREIILGEITDDAFTLMSGTQGTAMGHFSIPMRYSHSPVETSDIRDIEMAISGIISIVDNFNGNVDLKRG
ncbi:MAG: M42 family peptidase [Eubacteriales bacterium]